MDDLQMMLVKARYADLLAQAQRRRTVRHDAQQRRAERLIARADLLGAWAGRLRRRAAMLDSTCLPPCMSPRPGLVPPR